MSNGFLIDTNVPSELITLMPNARVVDWVAMHDDLYLSVISIGELRKGFNLLPYGRRRMQLEQWFVDFLLPLVASRVMPVTQAIGERWGALSAERRLMGTPLNPADGLIAATALEHNMTLVTRNVRDFEGLTGLVIVNPWGLEQTS